jgi:hypothetical protein
MKLIFLVTFFFFFKNIIECASIILGVSINTENEENFITDRIDVTTTSATKGPSVLTWIM